MSEPDILERMRADWNARAREDAHYYVAFGRREQDDAEFLATAADVVRSLDRELRRVPPTQRRAALEIGCGPGRVMRPLSRYFSEIHGVDVSDEMIGRAREKLRNIRHAHVHLGDGASLAMFAGDTFDFVYSYAVFQHIPSRDVVFSYLREAWRVLRTGGFLRAHINGLPAAARRYDTWSGVRISAMEVAAFAREQGFQLLAVEGADTQYMWTTMRKREAGWQPERGAARRASVCRITNAYSSEPVVPARGRFACVSLWLEGMAADCDLNDLHATIDGRPARAFYIGPPEVDGLQQLNITLPAGTGTGLIPVEVGWLGQPLIPATGIRVIPPGPAVPRLISVSDGVDLLSRQVVSGTVKIVLEEIGDPDSLRAFIGGRPVRGIDYFCTDPLPPRYEVNLPVPEGIAPGPQEIRLHTGTRQLLPIPIEIVAGTGAP